MKRKILASALALTLLGGGALALSGCKNDNPQNTEQIVEQTKDPLTKEQVYELFVDSYTSLSENENGIANNLKTTLSIATPNVEEDLLDPNYNSSYEVYNYKNADDEKIEIRLYKDSKGNMTGQEALCYYEEGTNPENYYVYHSSVSDGYSSITKEPYTNPFEDYSIMTALKEEIVDYNFSSDDVFSFTTDGNDNISVTLIKTYGTYDNSLGKSVINVITFDAQLDSNGKLIKYKTLITKTTDDGTALPTLQTSVTLEYGLTDKTIEFIDTYVYLIKNAADNQ